MAEPLFIESYSGLLAEGIFSLQSVTPWEIDQPDPSYVKRPQVLDKLYPTFGKLSLPDKLVFAVSSLLFKHYPEISGDTMSICIGMIGGSLSTDLRYIESIKSGFPSPSFFSATLPSSSIAEIAIEYKIKGPNRVVVGDIGCGFSALWLARGILSAGKAKQALVIFVDGIDPADRRGSTSILENSFKKISGPSASALLLSSTRTSRSIGTTLAISTQSPAKDKPTTEIEPIAQIVRHLSQRTCATIHISTLEICGSLTLAKDD